MRTFLACLLFLSFALNVSAQDTDLNIFDVVRRLDTNKINSMSAEDKASIAKAIRQAPVEDLRKISYGEHIKLAKIYILVETPFKRLTLDQARKAAKGFLDFDFKHLEDLQAEAQNLVANAYIPYSLNCEKVTAGMNIPLLDQNRRMDFETHKFFGDHSVVFNAWRMIGDAYRIAAKNISDRLPSEAIVKQ